MKHMLNLFIIALFFVVETESFMVGARLGPLHRSQHARLFINIVSDNAPTDSTDMTTIASTQEQQDNDTPPIAVRAPLKFIGPYPCLALRFPDLSTQQQRKNNQTGVSLDFLVDTAANINTIQAGVAQELQLKAVGQSLPGVSAGGALDAADTFYLGTAELEGIADPFAFMTNLTGAALPVASPASAGLLSMAFLQCFQGGVEFDWGQSSTTEQVVPPSFTFYGERVEQSEKDLTPVTLRRIPVTQLPSVNIRLNNGAEIPALLDTGSPITVLNRAAAQQAGIETVADPTSQNQKGGFFGGITSRWQQAQAAQSGNILTIMGSNGQPVNLLKSVEPCQVTMPSEKEEDAIDFGSNHIYVGDLPGLAALNGLGVDSPPAIVLGTDVLRQRPKMLLRAQDDQVWF